MPLQRLYTLLRSCILFAGVPATPAPHLHAGWSWFRALFAYLHNTVTSLSKKVQDYFLKKGAAYLVDRGHTTLCLVSRSSNWEGYITLFFHAVVLRKNSSPKKPTNGTGSTLRAHREPN